MRERYRFDDLSSFLALYYESMTSLSLGRTSPTSRRSICAGRSARAYGTWSCSSTRRRTPYGESPSIPFSTGCWTDWQVVQADHDLTGGLIMCFLRDRPVSEAMDTLRAVSHRLDDLLAVGLDSAEQGYPPSLFAGVFAAARSDGLRAVAHAGEEGPADYVRQALDVLGVERIDHGVRCLEDAPFVGAASGGNRSRSPSAPCRTSGWAWFATWPSTPCPYAGPWPIGHGQLRRPGLLRRVCGRELRGRAEQTSLPGRSRALGGQLDHASFAPVERKSELLAAFP